MSFLETLKGYKTVLFNSAITFGTVTDYFVNNASTVTSLVEDPKKAALAVISVSVVNIWLRYLTSSPMGRRSAYERSNDTRPDGEK